MQDASEVLFQQRRGEVVRSNRAGHLQAAKIRT